MKQLFTIILSIHIILQLNAQSGASINTTGVAADPSAGLDIQFNNKGLLIPKMTTNERNAITNPAQGLQIINTTTNCLEIYFSPIWQSIFCGCNPPAAPSEGTHSPSLTQIVWNWVPVNGATGYKYNTVNDYASAVDNGNNISYTQTGLTCNTAYTLYVWAYSNCGGSGVTALSQSTLACFTCGVNTINFTYKGSSVSYGTVSGQNGTCWLDRNLGATAVATAYNHFDSYGDLFQWGRSDDGHQIRTSGTTTSLSSNDVPGHSFFICNTNSPSDWHIPQNDNLWQGIAGINNPCPNNWRIPTETELNNECSNWTSYDHTGAFSNNLKWTSAGYRSSNGTIYEAGNRGRYWSSTVISSTNIRDLDFSNSHALVGGNSRADGLSVRCIKDY